MTTLAWFDTVLFTRLVLTFGHFLWQGAAIALVVLALSVVYRNWSAQLRYVLFLAALMLMTLCPVVTFWFVRAAESGPALSQPGEPTLAGKSDTRGFLSDESPTVRGSADGMEIHTSPPDGISVAGTQSRRTQESSSEPTTSEALADSSLSHGDAQAGSRWQWIVPYVMAFYLLGVMLLLGRLLLGLRGGRHLRRQSQLIDEPDLLSGIARSANNLGMRFTPTVLYCKQVAVPTVVGVFRPAILLPLSLTTGLSPDQVEAVLIHELAHVRRYDHLVNIVQRVIESLLFFHPVVWWISHRIRVEREHCCDDIVVALGSEPLGYAACLLDIAERGRTRRPSPQLETVAALHATNSGSQLGYRVKRLVNGASSETLRLSRGGHVLVLMCLALMVSGAALLRGQTESNVSDRETEEQKQDEPESTDVDHRVWKAEEKLLEIELKRAELRLDAADRELQEITKLFDAKLASPAEFNEREFAANQATLDVERTRAELVLHRQRKMVAEGGTGKRAELERQNRIRKAEEKLLEIELKRAELRLNAADKELKTITKLFEAKLASPTEFNEREFAANQAKLDVERAQAELLLHRAKESRQQATPAIKDSSNGPRAVVGKWMELVLADDVRDSWALTTKPFGSGLNAQHDLPRLTNKANIRVERSLGNESVAVVITNTVKHIETGKDRAFAFWLAWRDGSWLINKSYMDDPELIEEQLRGFFLGGGVKWHVTREEIVGTWLSGPGKAAGVGNKMCGSRFQLRDNGTFTMEMWGPGGPGDGTEVKRGTWRLEEDRIIREQDKERSISRISWMGNDSLVLQSADGRSLDGKSGTPYERQKAEKRDLPDKAQPLPAISASNTAKAAKTVHIPNANSEGRDGSAETVTDHERLQGAWKVVGGQKKGRAPPEVGSQFVFQPVRFQIHDDDLDGTKELFGTYTIDPSRSPKTIDLQFVSSRELPMLPAIYEFPDEGRLRICFSPDKTGRPTRPTSFDSKQGISNLTVLELRLEAKDKGPNASIRKVHLRNAEGGPGATVDDFLGVRFILDLPSGQTLAFPDDDLKAPDDSGQFLTNLKRGDILYAGHSLFCLRGAKAMRWDGNSFAPMKPGNFAHSTAQPSRNSSPPAANVEADTQENLSHEHIWTCSTHPHVRQPKTGKCPLCGIDLITVRAKSTGEHTAQKGAQSLVRYELTKFPCRLLIVTAEKRRFDVSILSVANDGGIDLEYREVVGSADSAQSVGELRSNY